MTKHNGINYTETQHGDVILFDGGAMGGKIKKLPNGKYQAVWSGGLKDTFEAAADAAQQHARSKYEHYRAFVMQYDKEARE